MAGRKWIKSTFPGVRYREHHSRKNGNQPDRYFAIRTYFNGQEHEEGLGWASEGWSAKKAAGILAELKKAQTLGQGPQNLKQRRHEAQRRASEEKNRAISESVKDVTFCHGVIDYYLPWARRNKISWPADISRSETHIIPSIGHIKIQDITRQDIEFMLEGIKNRGLSPATTVQCLALTRRMFNFFRDINIYGQQLFPGINPCIGITIRRPDNARIRFLSHDDATRLIKAAQNFDTDNALHDMIILALNTGMRLGEMQRLRQVDVDLTHNLIHILDRDGKPGGVAYINTESHKILTQRMTCSNIEPSALVFTPPAGGKVRENISQKFKELADFVGLNTAITDPRQRIVFHSLRHTFASWLALSGTDIYRIKELMRHKTITMTMRYAHLIPDAKRRAVENLPTFYSHSQPE